MQSKELCKNQSGSHYIWSVKGELKKKIKLKIFGTFRKTKIFVLNLKFVKNKYIYIKKEFWLFFPYLFNFFLIFWL